MTPVHPHLDPTTFWLLIILSLICLAAFCGRQAYHVAQATRMTLEQRNRVEAQRLMLRFCNAPSKQTYDTAWNFILANDVMLGNLDWPLVQRFTRTAVTAHFSTLDRP